MSLPTRSLTRFPGRPRACLSRLWWPNRRSTQSSGRSETCPRGTTTAQLRRVHPAAHGALCPGLPARWPHTGHLMRPNRPGTRRSDHGGIFREILCADPKPVRIGPLPHGQHVCPPVRTGTEIEDDAVPIGPSPEHSHHRTGCVTDIRVEPRTGRDQGQERLTPRRGVVLMNELDLPVRFGHDTTTVPPMTSQQTLGLPNPRPALLQHPGIRGRS